MIKQLKRYITKLEDEGYRIKYRKDTPSGDFTWSSSCGCGGYTEEEFYRIFPCKEHRIEPEDVEEEEEEDD